MGSSAVGLLPGVQCSLVKPLGHWVPISSHRSQISCLRCWLHHLGHLSLKNMVKQGAWHRAPHIPQPATQPSPCHAVTHLRSRSHMSLSCPADHVCGPPATPLFFIQNHPWFSVLTPRMHQAAGEGPWKLGWCWFLPSRMNFVVSSPT